MSWWVFFDDENVGSGYVFNNVEFFVIDCKCIFFELSCESMKFRVGKYVGNFLYDCFVCGDWFE